jgi:hypothetical protein
MFTVHGAILPNADRISLIYFVEIELVIGGKNVCLKNGSLTVNDKSSIADEVKKQCESIGVSSVKEYIQITGDLGMPIR